MLGRRVGLVVVVWLCVLAVGGTSAFALNEHVFSGSFGGEGSGNGQLTGPSGVAVNDATHDVYVVDAGDNRVEEFTSAGAYVGQFDGSAAPSGAFSSPSAIAVDNSGNVLDPSAGDVYVVDTGHSVIDKFSSAGTYLGQLTETTGGAGFAALDGVAVDASGVVWVYQGSGEIDSFSDALGNEYLAKVQSPFGTSAGFAVDAEGNLYVRRGSGAFAKINSAGEALIEEIAYSTAAAVDLSSNELFLGGEHRVVAYTSTGSLIERFGEEQGVAHLSAASGLAVDPSSGTVYVADSRADVVAVFNPVVVPDVTTGAASNVHAGGVTLNGTVNPDGIQLSDCRFEYGSDTSYGLSAPCVPAAASIPADSSEHAVSAVLTGLTSGASYHFRLAASNANGTNPGLDQVVNIGPGLHGESVLDVGSTGATLQANIEPHGAATSYYFQYGTSTGYGSQVPAAAASVGAGSGTVEVSQRASGLQPGATYHYRVVGVQGSEAFPGADHTFTTQAAGGGTALIDGRSWEMVSPESKQQAFIEPQGIGLIQASEDGSAIVYLAHSPINADAVGHPGVTQVFGRRGPGGWSAQELNTPDEEVLNGTGQTYGAAPYKLFSRDLSVGLLEPSGHTPLPPLGAGAEKTPYLHDVASGSNLPLVTPANVLPGAKIDEELGSSPNLHFEGATPDLSHLVLSSVEALTPQSYRGAGLGETNLYEWAGGQLKPVSVLPNGRPASEESQAAKLGWSLVGPQGIKRNVISTDGSRIVWSTGGGDAGVDLYLRDMVRGETVKLNAVQSGAGAGEGGAGFQAASSDGSRVFFSDTQALTEDATEGVEYAGDLYVFEVAGGGGPLSGSLRDLTAVNAGESAEVLGAMPGASDDGSYVYFVANGALAPGAVHGNCGFGGSDAETCSLYVVHNDGTAWGKPKLIAALSGKDHANWVQRALNAGLGALSARVSPGGRYLAFMSDRSVTGYDNRDAVSGERDQEVYLYDAVAGRVSCASCDPTGARPTGIHDTPLTFPLVDHLGVFQEGVWLAGSIPGWTSAVSSALVYQPRYLSDTGRLFFDSPVALVPGDVNGREDAYEREPAGVGGCQAGTHSARVVFSAVAGGCVGLISSGTSEDESAFVEASVSGGDVFFVTSAGLVPGDGDGAFDLYDAHECAGGSCPGGAAVAASPPCGSAEACRGGMGVPGVLGAPGSSTLAGGGNLAPPPAVVSKPKARGLSRAQKLARALRVCKRRPRGQRAVCRARARRAFGVGTSRAGKATARSGR